MMMGRANNSGSEIRAITCWKVESGPIRRTNCFGMLSRETGHSRVPAPPHMMTGIMVAAMQLPLHVRSEPGYLDGRCPSKPKVKEFMPVHVVAGVNVP